MEKRLFIIFIFIIFHTSKTGAQNCTTPGINPATAFPVCPTSIFHQDTVANCVGPDVAHQGCPEAVTSSKSHWYGFRCFQTGPLGFLIRGVSPTDDYDWILMDVTGKNPNDVFTDPTMQVSLNTYGTLTGPPAAPFPNSPTGCTISGIGDVHCLGDAPTNSPFNRMPTIIAGHDYLLMVTNWTTGSTLGYDLIFTTGAGNITDPKEPHLDKARAICDGTKIFVKFNKKMKCRSLLGNGSEFTISPPISNVISASGFGCSNGFAMDSVLLTLDSPLPPGIYSIKINTGSDANTVVDNCDNGIPNGEVIPLEVFPFFPTPMDSLTKPIRCKPNELQLVFRKNMRCNSIAPDGSDFRITGPTPVSVVSASGNCNADGLATIIKVTLSTPIVTKGNYNITLVTGSDGNTIIDECGKESIPGQFLTFATKDTVNADFNYTIKWGCRRDTIDYFYPDKNEVNSWKWNFDDLRRSTLQNPSILYGTFGLKTAQLIVSNGVCTDTSDKIPILLDNELKAKFEVTKFVCPKDFATFKNLSTGKIVSWFWDFGNGKTSDLQNPPLQQYTSSKAFTDVLVKLVVTNDLGCKDSVFQKIGVAGSCHIAVPNAFTPNGDNLNDFLYPVNAFKVTDLLFRVYNRVGQLVFETRDFTKRWDGKFKGQGADPGTYVWTLSYYNPETQKWVNQKGTSMLIR